MADWTTITLRLAEASDLAGPKRVHAVDDERPLALRPSVATA